MKPTILAILLPIIMILNGCATTISSKRHKGHHSHSRVSVGVHGHGSGGGALGALIIGGIIGAVINEASHESEEKELEKKKLEEKQLKEKQDIADRQRLKDARPSTINSINKDSATKWYQVGKDNKCYQMQTSSGVTDVLGLVDYKNCEN